MDQSSRNFFEPNARENAVNHLVFQFWISLSIPEIYAFKVGKGFAQRFQILDIAIRSGDIRAQSGKVSEIGPNLATFSPPIFLGGGTPKIFGPAFINWTCFQTTGKISRRSPYGPRRSRDEKNKERAVKHKAFQNYRSGRPNKKHSRRKCKKHTCDCTIFKHRQRVGQSGAKTSACFQLPPVPKDLHP